MSEMGTRKEGVVQRRRFALISLRALELLLPLDAQALNVGTSARAEETLGEVLFSVLFLPSVQFCQSLKNTLAIENAYVHAYRCIYTGAL